MTSSHRRPRMEGKVSEVLRGCLEKLPPLNSRLVRIFISSTFTDTVQERNTLMEKVYPRIKEYCKKKHGLDFQVVDMRWGVRKEVADDHMATILCLEEIYNCQKLSTGPNFVTFLGQKHGFRPLQQAIAADEFELLRDCLQKHGRNDDLIGQWYIKDENAVPAVYVLQPISSILVNNKESGAKWEDISGKIKECLKFASQECFQQGMLTAENKHKYFMSVTEEEIMHGVLNSDTDPSNHCLCFIRIIEDITNNLSHPKARRFIDMRNSQIDAEAQQLLVSLRDGRVAKMLKKLNFHSVLWSSSSGIDPEEHKEYLHEFCDQFYHGIISMIDAAMSAENRMSADDLYIEVLQHSLMALDRCSTFHGREDILERIQGHVTSQTNQPLVVFGESGCGKTSIMAKAASQIAASSGNNAVVILRFLGTSPRSSTMRKMLYSVCKQIAANYGVHEAAVPWDLNELQTFLSQQLLSIPAARPLYLILDSLDQLSSENFAHKLNWLPKELPKNVCLIVSTLPQHYEILTRLRNSIAAENFLEVPALGENLCIQVLKSWLSSHGRMLTEEQYSLVQAACENCSLPLFVKLLYEKVSVWKSYTKGPSELVLQRTLQDSIESLFERLEAKHGRLLVQHALAYLTASQNGLSEVELEDLLSLDDAVLDDVFQFHIPPVRRIPPLIWVRIRHDIAAYLVDKEADETRVSFWYHRQFIEAARERYLKDVLFAEQIHSAIADYYLGIWYGVKKPFRYNELHLEKLSLADPRGEADRKVASQPLLFGQIESNPTIPQRYNKRKLNQLPYHLARAGRSIDLKEKCLFNYKWLQTKLMATSVQQMLDDFVPLEEDQEASLLHKTLSMTQSTLNKYPQSLGLEISGRLLPYCTLGNKKNLLLLSLIKDCYKAGPSQMSLVPRQQCFRAPGGPIKYLLEHPTIPVGTVMVALAPDSQHLYALTSTNELLMWDLQTGEVEKQQQLIPSSAGKLNVVRTSHDQKYLLVASVFQRETNTNPLIIVDLLTGKVLESLQLDTITLPLGFMDSLQIGISEDKLLLMVVSQHAHCFSRGHGTLIKEIPIKADDMIVLPHAGCVIFHICKSNVYEIYDLLTLNKSSEIICPNTPLRFRLTASAQQGFIASQGSPVIQVVNLSRKDGEVGKTVLQLDTSKNITQPIKDIVVSTDEKYLLLRTKEEFFLWSLDKMNLWKRFPIPEKIKPNRNVLGFQGLLSPDSAYLLGAYEEYLLMWSVKSGSLMHTILADKSQLISLAISTNGKIAVTTSKNNNSIKVWKLDHFEEEAYEPLSLKSSCRYLHLSQTGELMVARSNQPNDVAVVDLRDGVVISRPSKEYDVLTPTIAPNGKSVVLREYTSEEAVKVWDSRTGHLQARIPVSSIQLKLVTVSRDSFKVATVLESEMTGEVQAKVWSTVDGRLLHTVNLGKGFINQAYFTLSDASLVIYRQIADSKSVQILEIAVYDCGTGLKTMAFPGIKRETMQNLSHDDSKALAVRQLVQGEGSPVKEDLVMVCLQTGKVVMTCPDLPLRRLVISGDGQTGIDPAKYIFDLVKGKRLFRFEEEETKRFHNPQLTFNGTFAIWICLEPGLFKVGHVTSQRIVSVCPVHSLAMALYISKDNTVTVGCEDGRIILLQLTDDSHSDGEQLFRESLARQTKLTRMMGPPMNDQHGNRSNTGAKSGICLLV